MKTGKNNEGNSLVMSRLVYNAKHSFISTKEFSEVQLASQSVQLPCHLRL